MAKVAINHYYEVAYALSDEMKKNRPWMTLKDNDNQYGWLS